MDTRNEKGNQASGEKCGVRCPSRASLEADPCYATCEQLTPLHTPATVPIVIKWENQANVLTFLIYHIIAPKQGLPACLRTEISSDTIPGFQRKRRPAMSVFAKSITFTFILCAAMMTTAVAQDSTTDVDWSNPDSIDVLQPDIGDFLDVDLAALEKIATDAYQAGEWEKAAKYYLALLRYDISDSGNIYNLACCYGLMGEAELAAKYLERAYRAGFTDIEHISWDPDFDSVRQSDASWNPPPCLKAGSCFRRISIRMSHTPSWSGCTVLGAIRTGLSAFINGLETRISYSSHPGPPTRSQWGMK
jgi:tetratricopeptide (TPR) repeat protein